MIIPFIIFCRFIESRFRRQISLDSDDRLDSGFLAFLIKLDSAIHYAMIGYGNRRRSIAFAISTSSSNFVRPSKE